MTDRDLRRWQTHRRFVADLPTLAGYAVKLLNRARHVKG